MITLDDVRGVSLFASLDDHRVQRLVSHAADIRVRKGDWVAREGEAAAFYILLSGRVEVSKGLGCSRRMLELVEFGEFFGVTPLLLEAPFLAGFQAFEPRRLMRLTPADFAALIAAEPEIRHAVETMLFQRVGELKAAVTSFERLPIVVGCPFDPVCHNVRALLSRNFVDYEWVDSGNESDLSRLPCCA